MIMQVQRGKECMLYALAMVLDTPAEDLRALVSMPVDRSLHPQELIDISHAVGYTLTIIEVCPYCTDPVELTQTPVYSESHTRARILKYITGAPGVCIVRTERGTYHALAWDGKRVFDPHGTISCVPPQNIYMFLKLVKL